MAPISPKKNCPTQAEKNSNNPVTRKELLKFMSLSMKLEILQTDELRIEVPLSNQHFVGETEPERVHGRE